MEQNFGLNNLNLQGIQDLKPDKESLYITYNKYKGYLFPMIVILASILILFMVIIPQINQYFSSKNQLDQATQQLNVLKNNYNYLVSLDDTQSSSDLKLLTKTLPSGKDFYGIMTAISVASARAGIAINSFQFSPGNLSKLTGSDNLPYPTIQVQLQTNGSTASLTSFLNELYKTVPLAEVYSIKLNNTQADLLLNFFFKPFPPQNLSDETPINPLSSGDKSLITNLYTWNNLIVQNGLLLSDTQAIASASVSLVASSSSQTNYSPF